MAIYINSTLYTEVIDTVKTHSETIRDLQYQRISDATTYVDGQSGRTGVIPARSVEQNTIYDVERNVGGVPS